LLAFTAGENQIAPISMRKANETGTDILAAQ